MESLREQAHAAAEQVERVLLGKAAAVEEVLISLLSGGHVLLEDVPGTGKTTLALAFSKAFALDCRRVQFTPDVLPSDLTGFSYFRRDRDTFYYQPGAVFCNLLLADELNRTSPRTQSALLEVMEEGQVTAEGVTRPVPKPFLVIATQNPLGGAGTSPLPDSQADRFAVSLSLGYPDFESEVSMAAAVGPIRNTEAITAAASREAFLNMQAAVHRVYLGEPVRRYLVELVTATRRHPLVKRGASPRATVALVKLSKAAAWYQGRDFVTPGDVLKQFPFAAVHRILPGSAAALNHVGPGEILKEIAAGVKRPRLEAGP